MEITSTTIGIPVSNLALSQRWYQAALELAPPELEAVEGTVEYALEGLLLQLTEEPAVVASGSVLLRFGVNDIQFEHDRLTLLDIDVSPIVHVDGAVDFFDFVDPDGHTFSLFSLVA